MDDPEKAKRLKLEAERRRDNRSDHVTTTSSYATPTGPGNQVDCSCGLKSERYDNRRRADERAESHKSYHRAMSRRNDWNK